MTKPYNNDYDKPIKIAEGIHWVGFADDDHNLHCNPYLIVEGEEAVLIDGGSRPDFSSVMMKILQTGTAPGRIVRLIYHHYDPDLCGSIPNFETIIGREDLKIISHKDNNLFIRYYGALSPTLCIDAMDRKFQFTTGRTLVFIRTPYAHLAGSFVTFDQQTGTLFSSDLFGSYDHAWKPFLHLSPECGTCDSYTTCKVGKQHCPILGILNFHVNVMTSEKALTYALQQLKSLPIERIAPQHGSVISREEDIRIVFEKLENLSEVGIDAYVKEERNE